MSPRHLLVLVMAIAALAVSACSDPGELGGPAIGGGPALRVGEFTMSHAELSDEVDSWTEDPAFATSALGVSEVGEPGRRSMSVVTAVLNLRLQTEQLSAMAAEAGLVPSAGDLDAAEQNARGQLVGPDGELAVSEEFVPYLARVLYYLDLAPQLVGQVDVPPVQISPRYGSPNAAGGAIVVVEPPAGSLSPGGEPASPLGLG